MTSVDRMESPHIMFCSLHRFLLSMYWSKKYDQVDGVDCKAETVCMYFLWFFFFFFFFFFSPFISL